jgi:hypothetical protein
VVRQAAFVVALAALLGVAVAGAPGAKPKPKGPRAVVLRVDGSGTLDYSLADQWVDPTTVEDCGTALPYRLSLRLHVPWHFSFARVVVPARKFYNPVISQPVTSDLTGSSYSFDATWYLNYPDSCAPTPLHCEGTLQPTEATFVADPDLDFAYSPYEYLRVYSLGRIKGTQDPCPYLAGTPESVAVVFGFAFDRLHNGFHEYRIKIRSASRIANVTRHGTIKVTGVPHNCAGNAQDRAHETCTQSAHGSFADHLHRLAVLR